MTLTAVWMSDVVDLEFLPLTKQHFMVGIFPFVLLCCVTCWAWADVSNSGKLLSQWCRTGLQQLKQLHSSWQVLFLVLRHCSLNGISVCYDVAINTVSFLKKTRSLTQSAPASCWVSCLLSLSAAMISRASLILFSHYHRELLYSLHQMSIQSFCETLVPETSVMVFLYHYIIKHYITGEWKAWRKQKTCRATQASL